MYLAELQEIYIVLHIFNKDYQGYQRAQVYTDNQATIISLYKPAQQLGQHVIKQIFKLWSILRHKGKTITL